VPAPYARLVARRNRIQVAGGHYHVTARGTAKAAIFTTAANPVRGGLCDRPRDWQWSSARATAGLDPVPKFLDVAWVLRTFAADDGEAAALYERMVEGGDCPR
jgi:hypothetical protein